MPSIGNSKILFGVEMLNWYGFCLVPKRIVTKFQPLPVDERFLFEVKLAESSVHMKNQYSDKQPLYLNTSL